MGDSLNHPTYCLITPARNESATLQTTILSLASQTILPSRWIIVDDGSTDTTAHIANNAAAQFPWIGVVRRKDRGFRKQGGGVIDAFYDGYNALATDEWDFLVKLDADLSFDPSYFEHCFRHFHTDLKLGIGGGTILTQQNNHLVKESNDPIFHVRGATKIYRRALWFQLGGLLAAPGWDTMDEIKAHMLGWNTYTFADVPLIHHRPTGAADGVWNNAFKNGRANYISGYHPLFMLAKCARRIFCKPPLLGALALLHGYITGYLARIPRVADPQLIAYLRTQQINTLLLRPSIWARNGATNSPVVVTPPPSRHAQ